jgi:hypothetical protein
MLFLQPAGYLNLSDPPPRSSNPNSEMPQCHSLRDSCPPQTHIYDLGDSHDPFGSGNLSRHEDGTREMVALFLILASSYFQTSLQHCVLMLWHVARFVFKPQGLS